MTLPTSSPPTPATHPKPSNTGYYHGKCSQHGLKILVMMMLQFSKQIKSMQESQQGGMALQHKIAQQEELITKLQAEDTKLSTYIKQFKDAMEKKIQKETSPKTNQPDQLKIQKQLEKQLDNAKTMLKNYHHELKVLQKKATKHKYSSEEIMEMENTLRQKQTALRQLNEDIKALHGVKRKQEKVIERKEKNEDGIRLTKIVEEIRKQKQVLQSLKNKHQQKQDTLQKRKATVSAMEQQYTQKCLALGEKPLKFEDFKERRAQKRREQSMGKQVEPKKDPKKHISIKEMINSHLELEDLQLTEKTLSELREKKTVAENSLKIARKKFEREVGELEERVAGLRAENQDLNSKYLQKRKERELIEAKQGLSIKRDSSKTMRRLEPIK